jgi:hypothetical protein
VPGVDTSEFRMNERRVLQRGVRGPGRGAWRRGLGLLALAVAWAAPRAAGACYCVAPELESSIDSADVIFEGMTGSAPEEIEQDIGLGAYGDVQTRRYDFEVLRYFKTDGGEALPPELALHTPAQGPACGRTFDTSQVYLIYARVREGGLLVDFRCSRTRSFDNAGEDLQALGEGVAPVEGQASPFAAFDAQNAAVPVSFESDVSPGAELGAGCSLSSSGGTAPGVALLGLGVSALALCRRRLRVTA